MKKKMWKIKQLKISIKSTNPSKNKKNNVRRLHIGIVNPSIKEIDLVELFGLNTTKYLKETRSLNMWY